jgi:hypothetical protein
MHGPSHAIRERREGALLLTAEMAIFHGGAQYVSGGNVFRTFSEGIVFGLGAAEPVTIHAAVSRHRSWLCARPETGLVLNPERNDVAEATH